MPPSMPARDLASRAPCEISSASWQRSVACNRFGGENVFLLADLDPWFGLGDFEDIVAFFQHAPERHVRIVAILRHVLRRHPERIGLHLECGLAAEEGFAAKRLVF